MIDNKNLLKILRTKLRKISDRKKPKFLAYKKDRSTTVEKTGDSFEVTENGCRKIAWYNLIEAEVLKQIKKVQKIELLRNNKLYLVRD